MKRYLVNLWRALLGKPYREERWYLVETEDDAVLVFDDGDRQMASVAYEPHIFERLLEGTGVAPARWRATDNEIYRIDGEVRRQGGAGAALELMNRRPSKAKAVPS